VTIRWRRLDHLQLLLVGALLVLGLMTLYSASPSEFHAQLAGLVLGAAAYAACALTDYRRLQTAAPWLYGAALLLLVAVAVLGHVAYGAQRWIRVGGAQVQPSEVAKVLLLIVLATYLSRRQQVRSRDLLIVGALGAPATILVLFQPDLGTAMVFAALLLGIAFLAGASRLNLAAIAVGGVGVLPLLPHLLHGYQKKRLEIFLDPSKDPLGAGYNLVQARIAVGSGGLFGQGWLHGAQGQLGYVPERTSDFVFAVFAEQFGLLGSLLLLVLFACLVFRILRAAAVAPDRFGELLCGGVALILLVQVVQNVGMNIGLTPVAGIPLPLISHGSSALVMTLAMLGLVQSVLLRRRRVDHASAAEAPERLLLSDHGTVRLRL
jgi:rod shape determining protein RodA